MPQLDWDATDFLACFEVEPDAEDYEVSHTYTVLRSRMRLLVTVWQHESAVQISVFREDSDRPVTSFACFIRGAAQYVNDKRGSFIRLANCVIGPNRFWYQEAGDMFDAGVYPHGVDVHLGVTPDIFLEVVAEKDLPA